MKKLFVCIFLLVQTLRVESYQFVHSIERAIPAVVFIANELNSFDEYFEPTPDSYTEWIRPFYEFLWPPQHYHGSGFIISEDGYVVTNAHVVNHVTHTFVILVDHDVRVLKASVVGVDKRTDLAVLKIETEDETSSFPVISFGDSDRIKIGEPIAVIGNPLLPHFESTVTTGVVSGHGRRRFHFQEVEGFLQIDAPVNPGNSGGPVINDAGDVVGVISWGLPWFEGLNFAIPSQIAAKVVKQLIEHGEVSSGYLGIELKDDIEAVFNVYQFEHNQGAIITKVVEGSPAEVVGLKKGDVIVELDGRPIQSASLFSGQLALIAPHEQIMLTIERDGSEMVLFVELSE